MKKNHVKGPANEAKGKTKDVAGKVKGDKSRAQRGKAELYGAEDDATTGGIHSNGKGSGD